MLTTVAPALRTLPMPATDSAQLIGLGIGELTANMPGQMPMMPVPLAGAAATAAVAVPWPISVSTGSALSVLRLPPAHSGWLKSGIESTRPSLAVGAGGGVGVVGATTALRHHWDGVSGSGAGGAWARSRSA